MVSASSRSLGTFWSIFVSVKPVINTTISPNERPTIEKRNERYHATLSSFHSPYAIKKLIAAIARGRSRNALIETINPLKYSR